MLTMSHPHPNPRGCRSNLGLPGQSGQLCPVLLCSVHRTSGTHPSRCPLQAVPWLFDCLPKSPHAVPHVPVVGSPGETATTETLPTASWVRTGLKDDAVLCVTTGQLGLGFPAWFLSGASLRELQKGLMNAQGAQCGRCPGRGRGSRWPVHVLVSGMVASQYSFRLSCPKHSRWGRAMPHAWALLCHDPG